MNDRLEKLAEELRTQFGEANIAFDAAGKEAFVVVSIRHAAELKRRGYEYVICGSLCRVWCGIPEGWL